MCASVCARARTQTHTHPKTMQQAQKLWTKHGELCVFISCSFAHVVYEYKKPAWVRNIPSSYFLVYLQYTSSWHFQSGLALTKAISCFALKKWITWNGNLAAKSWKIVPGPNICPKWAQLRSPWRSGRSGWAGREPGRRKMKTVESLLFLKRKVLCDTRYQIIQLPHSAPHFGRR